MGQTGGGSAARRCGHVARYVAQLGRAARTPSRGRVYSIQFLLEELDRARDPSFQGAPWPFLLPTTASSGSVPTSAVSRLSLRFVTPQKRADLCTVYCLEISGY